MVCDVGEVGAGVGLGVALRPELLDGQDPGQEAPLLLLGAERDQGRAEQLLAEVVDPGGRVGPGVLLVEDHLLPQAAARGRRAPPASRRRSSRARRGAGSRRAAPRCASCSRPGPPRPLSRRTRRRGAPPATPGSRRGTPRPRRRSSGPRLVSYQANVWFGVDADDTVPALLREAAERFGDAPRRTSRATAPCPTPSCSSRVERAAARLRRAAASAAATGSCSGARTASTGRSPRSRSRTPAACWCP